MTTEIDRAVTVIEAVALLSVSRSTVDRLINSGRLASFKVGSARRILLSDIAAIQRGGLDDPLDEAVKLIVDEAPALTPAQRDKLSALFAPDKPKPQRLPPKLKRHRRTSAA